MTLASIVLRATVSYLYYSPTGLGGGIGVMTELTLEKLRTESYSPAMPEVSGRVDRVEDHLQRTVVHTSTPLYMHPNMGLMRADWGNHTERSLSVGPTNCLFSLFAAFLCDG